MFPNTANQSLLFIADRAQSGSKPAGASVLWVGLTILFSLFLSPVVFNQGAVYAQSLTGETIILSDDIPSRPISQMVEYLEDKEGRLKIADVSRGPYAAQFKSRPKKGGNFGTTDSAIWVRLRLRNNTGRANTWLLEHAYPPMDRITVYRPEENGGFNAQDFGDAYEFSRREMKHRHNIFPLRLKAGQTKTYFLRFQTESQMDIPLNIWTEPDFQLKDHDEQYALGLYYGIMLVMLLYNLFIYFTVRDHSYLYYAAYIVFVSVLQMALNGLAYEYLWPNAQWFNNKSILFFICLSLIAVVQFTRTLLDITKEEYPKITIWINVTLALLTVVFICAFFLPYKIINRAGAAILIYSAVTVLTIGTVRLISGYRPAKFYMFAWSFLLIAIIMRALKNATILPSVFITNYGIQIGSAIEVILLSFALADKINLIKQEKEQAQARYIESQQVALDNQLRLMNSFYRFVPGEFIKNLEVENITDIKLGDAVLKTMTVLFTDIRNFTGISEGMTPEENFRFLNSFLKRMEPSIEKHNGFVDKFVGDGIMALYPQSPEHSLASAIEMRAELADYNEHRRKQDFEPIEIGIGINTGEVMLGTVGSANRIDTTVIGNTVNLAARLEGLTKIFKLGIIVSDFCVRSMKEPGNFALREIDQVTVKGKTEPVIIYESFDNDTPRIKDMKFETRGKLLKALVLYKQGEFADGLNVFQEVLDVNPNDRIVKIYIKRCNHYIANPPRDNWDGVSKLQIV